MTKSDNFNSNDFHLECVTISYVVKMLGALNEDTATGSDDLPAMLLKKTAHAIAPNITLIINSSITTEQFPDSWKRAIVTGIWKRKGLKSEPNNYRPISVLPVLARMFEKECVRQLFGYCESNQIIPMAQFGFRSKSNCEIALLLALDGWMKEIDEGKFVGFF